MTAISETTIRNYFSCYQYKQFLIRYSVLSIYCSLVSNIVVQRHQVSTKISITELGLPFVVLLFRSKVVRKVTSSNPVPHLILLSVSFALYCIRSRTSYDYYSSTQFICPRAEQTNQKLKQEKNFETCKMRILLHRQKR